MKSNLYWRENDQLWPEDILEQRGLELISSGPTRHDYVSACVNEHHHAQMRGPESSA